MWPFEAFLFVHIACGAVGLVLFWIPTLGKKGSQTHRKVGHWYARLMLVTASMAFCMSLSTLLDPLATHPKQVALDWPQWRIEGIFGWMMMYLSILTIHLVWHGVVTIRNKKQHPANRHWANIALNVLTIAAALLCAYRGWLIRESLMMTDGSRFKKSAYGTISYLPATFGAVCASVAIRDLLDDVVKTKKSAEVK
jgi:uncharacterized membrane protein